MGGYKHSYLQVNYEIARNPDSTTKARIFGISKAGAKGWNDGKKTLIRSQKKYILLCCL